MNTNLLIVKNEEGTYNVELLVIENGNTISIMSLKNIDYIQQDGNVITTI